MSDNSLFAVLLRSQWWISIAVAVGIGLLVKFFVPEEHLLPALSITIPFLFTGILAAWKQWRVPGAGRIASTVETVSAMSSREFLELMEASYQRDGFAVSRINGAADLKLSKDGRVTLVCCKRWKAQSQGIESLRELEAVREAREAREALYVAVIELSEAAWMFARDHRIAIMRAPQLTRLLRLPKKPLARR